jgi:hypothetical protein
MPDVAPSVVVGRHVLVVGGPAGTLIAGEADADASALEEGLRAPRIVDAASEATARVEEAVDLAQAVADGTLTDLGALSGRIEVFLALLERLDRDGRYEEELRLARALNGVLGLLMRWADLARTLGLAGRAAERLGDLASAAWVDHELGTLHLAAGDLAEAQRRLNAAQRVRRKIGDAEGLAATERNLGALCRDLVRDGQLRRGPSRVLLAALAALLLLLGGAIGALAFGGDEPPPPAGAARLTVELDGEGEVTSVPAGIDCPGECERDFVRRSRVVLTPAAAGGWEFAGWQDACEDGGPCTVRLRRDRTARAVFRELETQPATATLTVEPPAGGRVDSQPEGIACPPTCSHAFADGAPVTLTAAADPGFAFSEWGGDCSGSQQPCPLEMTADRTVSVALTEQPTLTVEVVEEGIVTSDPAGIACPAGACSARFPPGTVTLTADDDVASWSVDSCSSRLNTCAVPLEASLTVTVTFAVVD